MSSSESLLLGLNTGFKGGLWCSGVTAERDVPAGVMPESTVSSSNDRWTNALHRSLLRPEMGESSCALTAERQQRHPLMSSLVAFA